MDPPSSRGVISFTQVQLDYYMVDVIKQAQAEMMREACQFFQDQYGPPQQQFQQQPHHLDVRYQPYPYALPQHQPQYGLFNNPPQAPPPQHGQPQWVQGQQPPIIVPCKQGIYIHTTQSNQSINTSAQTNWGNGTTNETLPHGQSKFNGMAPPDNVGLTDYFNEDPD
jgi:hypothetical protein